MCAFSGSRGLFGEGERLALELAQHAEREGGLVQIDGRAEEHRLWFKWGRSGDREDCGAAGRGPCGASAMILREMSWNSSMRYQIVSG